ncbi:hypothetical protein [Nodosilinea sp. FACHB-13]|uniref:hypothetical protein n=1 Tax=Cyanophyceae TaxID=3028117 RepID=UPI001684AAC6|nr:hypothetical protein [Nodosilinea sp. FACHB-13]MBD2107036.1 hypothetical protein [Nodosilinea sp. FACHB-13]
MAIALLKKMRPRNLLPTSWRTWHPEQLKSDWIFWIQHGSGGIEKGLLTDNPWADMRLRNPPQQKRKAFTKDEMQGILKGFAENYYYCHYTDCVRFKLSTGCRWLLNPKQWVVMIGNARITIVSLGMPE